MDEPRIVQWVRDLGSFWNINIAADGCHLYTAYGVYTTSDCPNHSTWSGTSLGGGET